MLLVKGGWGQVLKISLICAACLAAGPALAWAQPQAGNATLPNAHNATAQEAGTPPGDDFATSSAADSHDQADLDLIRQYNQALTEESQAPAPKEGAGRSSLPLAKVTPPKGPQPTALRLFRLIPPTIFENTVEGLDENEKQILADNGRMGPWALTFMTDDELEFTSSVPHSGTKVRMRLYHAANGDIFISCGVQSGESCAMELWRRDTEGRIIPVAIPDEPGIAEFLAAGRSVPEDYEVSMLICQDADTPRLKAVPLLWTPTGLGSLTLDYDVYYQWTGEAFSKELTAHKP